LGRNGYEVVRGKRVKVLKLAIREGDVPEIDFGNLKATPQEDDGSLKLAILNAISSEKPDFES